MTIVGYLPAMRRVAESLMLDEGKALRPTGGMEYVDGQDQVATEPLFGPVACKIQARNLVAREAEVGARTSVTVRSELHLPVSAAPLQVGDLWELTTVHPLSACVVGQRFRVLAPVGKTLATARRYEIEEIVS